MRFELKRLQRELGLTTVYVTHDQSEALALSHEIAVMNEGRIVQIGTPREIYERPTQPVRRRFRRHHQFHRRHGASRRRGNGRCVVRSAIGELKAHAAKALTQEHAPWSSRCGRRTWSCPSRRRRRAEGDNVCKGTVGAKDFLGDYLDFQVKVGDVVLLARAHPSLRTPTGDPIYLRMKAEKCVRSRSPTWREVARPGRTGAGDEIDSKTARSISMAKDAIVSDDLAKKFATEKETPYTRWVQERRARHHQLALRAEPAHRRAEALGAARRHAACSSTTRPRAPRTTATSAKSRRARSSTPQRQLFEEMILILDGRGSTTVWNDAGQRITFEWKAGALFAIPLNCWHQHFNGSGQRAGALSSP